MRLGLMQLESVCLRVCAAAAVKERLRGVHIVVESIKTATR